MTGPYYDDDLVTLHLGDCLDVLAGMEPGSVDAVVTDPPYGLEFMGREWDTFRPSNARIRERVDQRTNPSAGKSVTRTPEAYVAGAAFGEWCEEWAAECLRVLKPGGHLLAFGGTRTYHWLACGIERAGFEIRDSLHWIYGSGFPKSMDVSKAIDKAAGAQRQVVGARDRYRDGCERRNMGTSGNWNDATFTTNGVADITVPATEDAARWDGWGTALKPAHEPVVFARKPLGGTVAANVLEHGTGAVNLKACLVGTDTVSTHSRGRNTAFPKRPGETTVEESGRKQRQDLVDRSEREGRWPPNVLLTHLPGCYQVALGSDEDDCAPGCPVAGLDAQSGVLTSGANPARRSSDNTRDTYGEFAGQAECTVHRGADSGGASRFFPVFRYQAKAPASECPRLEDGTAHPTVKPLELMRWLVRLVTPPGGIVLDPFAGSGTTGEACVVEGFRSVLIERDPKYADLIAARLRKPIQPDLFGGAA